VSLDALAAHEHVAIPAATPPASSASAG
jgi:hypothetical protein